MSQSSLMSRRPTTVKRRRTTTSPARERVRGLVESMRYEVLPTPSIADRIAEHLPPGRTVTVTASPSKGLEATLELAERLARGGYDVVPHLAARMVHGRVELEEIVARLTAVGVESVFVPGGDAAPTEDGYHCSLDLLADLTALGRPFREVGVAGYPESHPMISDDVTIQAMWDKRAHATQAVSNLCFDPDQVATWVWRIRQRGMTMPVFVGLPGPVERTRLLSMATKIGVGESVRFLAKNRSVFARVAAPGGFRPDRFLQRLAPAVSWPGAGVAGVHMYTFNQVGEAEDWRRRMLQVLTPLTE